MSLINDALKRAKQAQQPDSPDSPQSKLQYQRVQPGQQPKKGNSFWIAVVIIAGLIIGFVIHHLTRENNPNIPKEVKAREIVPVAPETNTASATAAPTNATASAPVADESAAKPAPKLQAVVFDPKRPSAIISGKSVFVGDRLGDLKVVAITQESVTVFGGGHTNVLVLGE